MYIYKFRVYFDDVEDFVRDVEILSTDNFESLHKLLYECIGLKGNEFAAFSICDQKWNKQKEITLMDTSDEMDAEEPEYNEDDSYSTKVNLPKFVMKDAVIKDFIGDPHQHIMYEYDFMNPKIFYIELQKVVKSDEDATKFPRCTYKSMELPVVMTNDMVQPEEVDDYIEDEDEYFDDDEGYNEEDFNDLNEFTDF